MTPPLPSRKHKSTHRKTIDGEPLIYRVDDEEIFLAPSNAEKAFALQRLLFSDGHVEYRICYYMIARKPRMRGKWAFGQFAPMMTAEEMQILFQKATAKGWILVDSIKHGSSPELPLTLD